MVDSGILWLQEVFHPELLPMEAWQRLQFLQNYCWEFERHALSEIVAVGFESDSLPHF